MNHHHQPRGSGASKKSPPAPAPGVGGSTNLHHHQLRVRGPVKISATITSSGDTGPVKNYHQHQLRGKYKSPLPAAPGDGGTRKIITTTSPRGSGPVKIYTVIEEEAVPGPRHPGRPDGGRRLGGPRCRHCRSRGRRCRRERGAGLNGGAGRRGLGRAPGGPESCRAARAAAAAAALARGLGTKKKVTGEGRCPTGEMAHRGRHCPRLGLGQCTSGLAPREIMCLEGWY